MKTIYLAHPYGGLTENICKSIDLERVLLKENSDIHIFNAAAYFHKYKDVLIEDEILKHCVDMVRRCDELWLSPGWENSPGCVTEYETAVEHGIPVAYLPTGRGK